MTIEEEKAIIDRIREQPHLFGLFFDEYYKPILGYLYRRLGDYGLAHDMTAETFLKGFLHVAKFKWRGFSISAWLYRIATNEINQYLRKRQYAPQTWREGMASLPASMSTSYDQEKQAAEEELKQHEAFIQIQVKLKTLDARYQEVIALRYFEGKDNREIAHILEKPEGTIKSLLSRGLQQLRDCLENKSNDHEAR